MQHPDHPLDAALLGKIMLARVLVLPLQKFHRLVCRTESSGGFAALRSLITVGQLAGARVAHAAEHLPVAQSSAVLGEVRIEAGDELVFLYQHDSYAREYRFDESGVTRLLSSADAPAGLTSVLRRLHLINTRNRLAHALMQQVLASQASYLRSGQVLTLRPLSQAAVAAQLRSMSNLAVVADPGRISRLVRGLSIRLLNGSVVPLSALLTKPRQLHRHFVDDVIKKEKDWMLEGVLQAPLTDDGIAALLDREYGIHMSRRTVANVRRDLAIPDCRLRCRRMQYLAATAGFSALLPLTAPTLRASVPARSGVYEIRTNFVLRHSSARDHWTEKNGPAGQHSVLYIGSAVDLRKRLSDHLRGHTDNAVLHDRIVDGAARVRFRLLDDGWRLVERDLYRVFCETFGAPPLCNRVSP